MTLSPPTRSARLQRTAAGYAAGVAAVAVATLIRWILDPALGDYLPLITYFLAVLYAAWFTTLWPSVVVLVLGALACEFLFVAPRYSATLHFNDPQRLADIARYVVVGASIIGVCQVLRRARSREFEHAERMRTTLASIGDGVITTDFDGRVTGMNAVAEALTGWSNDEAAGVPLTRVFRIVNESSRLEVENPALRALKEGITVGLANHTLLIAKDGTERPIDDSAAPIRSALGEIVGTVLVFRDISERHRAQAEQRAAQDQMTSTLESVTDGFVRYDRDWRVVYMNAEAERINRLSRVDALGRVVWELFPAVVGTKLEAEFRRAVTDRVTVEFENYYEPFDRWYSLKGYPTPDGGLTTFIRDITEKKRFESQLMESEARYRAVGESIDYGVWMCDSNGRNVYASDSFLRMVGITQEQCSDFGWGDVLHPEDAEATIAAWQECVRTKGTWDRVHRFRGADGQWRHVLARGVPLRDAAGMVIGWAGINLDITRMVEAEQQIVKIADESERARRFYETILGSTPDFVYVFSLDYKVVYANDSLLRMWGRDHGGAIGKTFLEIGYLPWHAEMHEREIDQVRATRQPIRGVVPFNGTLGRRQYDYIFVPVIGTDGEVEAVAGTTRDVTERLAAEERQAFLVRLADRIRPLSDPVVVQAEASRLLGEHLGANRVVYFEIRGDQYVVERDYASGVRPLAGRYPVAAFGKALLADLFNGRTIVETDATTEPERPPGERAAFAEIQVRGHVDVPLVKGGKFVAGMTVQCSDRRDWSREDVELIEDTAERTWAAVERARVEAALRQSEERRRLALDAAELGAWQVDLSTNVLTTDERFRMIFAGNTRPLDYEEALSAVHPDDRDRVREAVAAATRSDDPAPYAEEYRVVHKDGSVRWVFAKGRAHSGGEGSGQLVSFDGTLADITDHKDIEVERERLLQKLQQQDRRKDEFLATLAHELRNPLSAAGAAVHLLHLKAPPNPDVQWAYEVIERQTRALTRLIDDLMDVSRINRGKVELRREQVELATIVQGAVETSRPLIDEMGHQLTVTLPPGPLSVDADRTRLEQVFQNLLHNAAKYTERGGRIALRVTVQAGSVVVSVTDTGIGIPADKLPTIFEMFSQVEGALSRSQGGLGIGLSLVKRLVEMHGGSVEARSSGPGKGSEFIVRLPIVVERGHSPGAAEDRNNVVPTSDLRILVVDDSRDAAEGLTMLLKAMGNTVHTAYDGEEAVAAAKSFRPHVVLCDIGLPKLNGYEACRRMKKEAWDKEMVLIAVTGWGQEEDRRKSEQAGFDHHIVKPVDPHAIMKLLAGLDTVTG